MDVTPQVLLEVGNGDADGDADGDAATRARADDDARGGDGRDV